MLSRETFHASKRVALGHRVPKAHMQNRQQRQVRRRARRPNGGARNMKLVSGLSSTTAKWCARHNRMSEHVTRRVSFPSCKLRNRWGPRLSREGRPHMCAAVRTAGLQAMGHETHGVPNQTPKIKPLLIQSRSTRNTRKPQVEMRAGLGAERQDGKAQS